mgnify:CR=1 FL=1
MRTLRYRSTTTSSATVTLTINPQNDAPVANANGPYNGTAGVTLITFDGSASNDPDGAIVAYDWDFGDGGTSTAENPVHTYDEDGTYEVTVRATDGGSPNLTYDETFTVTVIDVKRIKRCV